MYKRVKRKTFEVLQIGDKSDWLSRSFDIFIAVVILLNISVLIMETFDELAVLMPALRSVEIATTLVFCVEYVLRIWTADYLYEGLGKVKCRFKFLVSFDGIIDLLTIIPAFFLAGFVVFRMLRVVRIFHLFRLNAQYDSFNVITNVLWQKKNQILSSVFIIVTLMLASSLCMYSAEHDAQPEAFKNAFSGIWWSMSTLLTVGYGDIYPITTTGRIMAIFIAMLGVGVVAIPTGIISAGFIEQYNILKKDDTITVYNYIRIAITRDGELCGKCVKDMPSELRVLFVVRDLEVLLPTPELQFCENDFVFISAIEDEDVDGDLIELSVDADNKWINKKLKDIDISQLMTVIHIRRGDKVISAEKNTVIEEGDVLVIYDRTQVSA